MLWAPSFFLLGTIVTWQLIITTVTTIVTFLLVALLQNTQKRSDDAVQHKLNAIADGLADLMKQLSKEHLELGKDLKETTHGRWTRRSRKCVLSHLVHRMRPLRLQNL